MKQTLISTVLVLLLIGGFALVFPWRMVSWGKVQLEQPNVISVSGYAESSRSNQMATFSATVSATNANKQAAIDKVNADITDLISKLKAAGIPSENIKTQSLSVYQNENPYSSAVDANGVRSKDWVASNSIEIKFEFKDQGSVEQITNLLASSGATNIWGPNFAVNTKNTMEEQKALLDAAIKDARDKAQIIANSSGRHLGRIVTVNEGGTNYGGMPMYDRAMGMGGGGNGVTEPGTSNISQTVTVVFELK